VFPGLAQRTVSGAPPDSVWCTRMNQLQLCIFGFPRRSSAIIHRTVRCTSGATAIYAQWSTLMDEQCNTVPRQKSEQQVRGAPDCPVPHEDKASNGQPAPNPNDRVTWQRTGHCPVAHRTVRCAHRQQPSPTATNLVGGYKYHPNQPLQGVGAQATFQVI
jgi:hypothetical protein